ncbi:MAG: hypothetical protein ACUVUU_06850 [bacterium]
MRRLTILVLSLVVLATVAYAKQQPWDPEVEKSSFTEINRPVATARENVMDLYAMINKEIKTKSAKDQALTTLKKLSDFVDILQFYYLPVLNARSYVSRAYREVQYSMYTEAAEDIKKAVEELDRVGLKATEPTKAALDLVKNGLISIQEISDKTKKPSLLKLSNSAKQLNMLIEKIRPTIVTTEEGENLVEGNL